MKRTIIGVMLTAFALMAISPLFAGAEMRIGEAKCITDEAGLLNDAEREALEEKASELSGDYALSVFFLSLPESGSYGADIEEAARNFYGDYSSDKAVFSDSLVLALDMAGRDYVLYGTGEIGEQLLDREGISYLEESFLAPFGDGEWYEGVNAYLNASEQLLEAEYYYGRNELSGAKEGLEHIGAVENMEPAESVESAMPVRERQPVKEKNPLMAFGSAVVIGLLAAVFTTSSMKAQMKSAKTAVEARNYIVKDSVGIYDRQDSFTHRTRSERIIEDMKSNSRSSGSGGFSGISGGGSSRGKF